MIYAYGFPLVIGLLLHFWYFGIMPRRDDIGDLLIILPVIPIINILYIVLVTLLIIVNKKE